jgi:hypothetical protein
MGNGSKNIYTIIAHSQQGINGARGLATTPVAATNRGRRGLHSA